MGAITDILIKAISDAPLSGILRERLELARERAEHLEARLTSLEEQLRKCSDSHWRTVLDDVRVLYTAEIEVLQKKLLARDASVTEITIELDRQRRENEFAQLLADRMSGGCVNEFSTFNAGAKKQ